MEGRSFTQGAVGKRHDPIPCPRCYQPAKETKEGFACPTHGLLLKQPKAKR